MKISSNKSRGPGVEKSGKWFRRISHLFPDPPGGKQVKLSKKAHQAIAAASGTSAAGQPEIPVQTIRTRLRTILSPLAPGKVGYNDKISKYVGGGALQIVAFIDVVNKYPPFRADGLALTPNQIPDDPIVGWFDAAIIADYRRRGWNVVL